MAVGESVVFDEDRFLTYFRDDDAITVTCENRDEFRDFVHRISHNDKLKPHINDYVYLMCECYDEDEDGWINVYTPKSGEITASTAKDCNYDYYDSDYYYKDITFKDTPRQVKVDSDELMAFIIKVP